MDHPVTGLDMLWMKIASSVGQPELQHLKSFVKTQTKFTYKNFRFDHTLDFAAIFARPAWHFVRPAKCHRCEDNIRNTEMTFCNSGATSQFKEVPEYSSIQYHSVCWKEAKQRNGERWKAWPGGFLVICRGGIYVCFWDGKDLFANFFLVICGGGNPNRWDICLFLRLKIANFFLAICGGGICFWQLELVQQKKNKRFKRCNYRLILFSLQINNTFWHKCTQLCDCH